MNLVPFVWFYVLSRVGQAGSRTFNPASETIDTNSLEG